MRGLSFCLIFSLVSQLTFAQTGFKESLGKFTDEAPNSLATYEHLCKQELDENVLDSKSTWKPICEIVKNSDVCRAKDISPEHQLNCNSPSDAKMSYWQMGTTKECVFGLFDALKDFAEFIGKAALWVFKNSLSAEERNNTSKALDKGALALEGYIVTEMDKIEDEALKDGHSVSSAEKLAKKEIVPHVLSQVMGKLAELIEQSHVELGCYGPKERSRQMCRMIGTYFVPPVAAMALLAKGTIKTGLKVAQKLSSKKPSSMQIVKSSMKDTGKLMSSYGFNAKTIKSTKENITNWIQELEKLAAKASSSDKKLISKVISKMEASKNPDQLLEAAHRYSKGEDPFLIANKFLKTPETVDVVDMGLVKSLSPNINPKILESYLRRLASESPEQYLKLVQGIEKGTIKDPKLINSMINKYKKSNDVVMSLKGIKALEKSRTQTFVPITLFARDTKMNKGSRSSSKAKVREFLYENTPKSDRDLYRVTELSNNKFILEATVDAPIARVPANLVVPVKYAEKYRNSTAFRWLYDGYRNIEDIFRAAKSKYPKKSDAELAKEIKKVCK